VITFENYFGAVFAKSKVTVAVQLGNLETWKLNTEY
jgi:hypothetical protein